MGRQQRRMGSVKRTALQTPRGGAGRRTLQAERGGEHQQRRTRGVKRTAV